MARLSTFAIGIASAAAVAFTALTASAQLAPPAPRAQPAAPAAKAPPAAPAAKAPAAKAAPKKAASACQGLDEKGCAGKAAECRWIAAVKRKDGKEVAAYCRSVPKSVKAAPKKVDAAKVAPKKVDAAAKGPAGAAPAPKAKAPAAATK